jgi:ornithine decarboxylase
MTGHAPGQSWDGDDRRDAQRDESQLRHVTWFRTHNPPTPCLVVDLDVVALRYLEMRAVLPRAEIFYAVKANPAPDVIRTLSALGSSFDVASPEEADLCLSCGSAAEKISYGNTIKRTADIAYAWNRGITLFAFDSECELRKIAEAAPGASVFCRILVDGSGAQWPLSRKFGCTPAMAAAMLQLAPDLGLQPCGVSFHVGSQQLDPTRWESAISDAAGVFGEVGQRGIPLSLLNLGGGFPARYSPEVPGIAEYAKHIDSSLRGTFNDETRVIVEPGRFLVGDAGVLRSRVVLIAHKSHNDDTRWVYLDVGRFRGLAETENEAISYPLVTGCDDGGEVGPVTLAGPTCDSADVIYEQTPRHLPMALKVGDYVDFLCTGAYTASYSSVAFNGFPPLPTYVFGGKQ